MAAKRKIPNYVEKVGTDGRRYFKPAFIAGVVADIRAGKNSVEGVANEFNISTALVYRWLAKNPAGNYPGAKRTRERAVEALPVGNGATLLEKAMAAGTTPSIQDGVDDNIAQNLELAEAWVLGKVSDLQVKIALGKSLERKFMATTWCGQVFAGAIRSGWKMTR